LIHSQNRISPFNNFWIEACLLTVIGLALYFNTFFNEYALDDRRVIIQNDFVRKGFAGIKDILLNDTYASYHKQMGSLQQLSGGRYRPLSIITFAIEL
jgi:hypothetical protein